MKVYVPSTIVIRGCLRELLSKMASILVRRRIRDAETGRKAGDGGQGSSSVF